MLIYLYCWCIGIVIRISSADNVLKNILPSFRSLNHEKTKNWNIYAKCILQEMLKKTLHTLAFIKKLMFQMYQFTHIFKTSMLPIKWKDTDWHSVGEDLYYQPENDKFLFITYPAGYIDLDSSFNFGKSDMMIFIFTLDKSIRLNLTFQTVYFPVPSSLCHMNYLMISTDFDHYTCHEKRKEATRIICGHYPTFSFYPEKNNVHMSIFRKTNDINFLVETIFQVMDRNYVFNIYNQEIRQIQLCYGEKNGFDTTLVYAIKIFSVKILRTYFLKSLKTHYIRIYNNVVSLKSFVYNGPGFRSRLLPVHSSYVTLTTFQGVIQILTKNLSAIWKNEHLVYLQKEHTMHSVLKPKMFSKDYLHFPSKHMNNIDIYTLYTSKDYNLNVTIIHWISGLDTFPHCTYGGLHVSQKSFYSEEESNTVCHTHSIGSSIYSENSSLIIVYYQYKEYDEVNITVQISQVKCKPVEINICKLYNFCLFSFIPCTKTHHVQNKLQECNYYLKNVTKKLNINIMIRHSSFEVFQNDEACVVLQFKCLLKRLKDVFPFFINLGMPMRIALSIKETKTKIDHVKFSLHKSFPLDIFLYREIYSPHITNHIEMARSDMNSYDINNSMSDRIIQIRYFNEEDWFNILSHFSFQTHNWMDVQISSIQPRKKQYKRQMIYFGNFHIISNKEILEKNMIQMTFYSPVLLIQLGFHGVQSKNFYYFIDVIIHRRTSSKSILYLL